MYVGLFSLGPILAVQFTDIKEAGYLSISQTLLYTIGLIFAPMSLIFLPKVGNLIKNNRHDLIASSAEYIIEFVLYAFFFASAPNYSFLRIKY